MIVWTFRLGLLVGVLLTISYLLWPTDHCLADDGSVLTTDTQDKLTCAPAN